MYIYIYVHMNVKVQVAQSCPTLCDPVDYTVHGILQARILEWVAFPFSRESSNPEIKPRSLTLQADSLSAELQGKPFCHKDGVNSISEFIDISPGSLGFSLCFMQPGISHDVLCI